MPKEQRLGHCTISFLFYNNRYVVYHQLKYSAVASWQATVAVPFLNQGVSGPAYIHSVPVTYKQSEVLNPSFSMEKRKMECSITLTLIALW